MFDNILANVKSAKEMYSGRVNISDRYGHSWVTVCNNDFRWMSKWFIIK